MKKYLSTVFQEIKEMRRRQFNEEVDKNGMYYVANIVNYLEGLIKEKRLSVGNDDNDILEIIRHDRNILSSQDINDLVGKGLISKHLLAKTDIDPEFINMIGKRRPSTPTIKKDHIIEMPDGATEVYMWGLPSCGKTCLIGAIMAAAKRCRVTKGIEVLEGPGMLYGTNMLNYLRRDGTYCWLPGRTPSDCNYAVHVRIWDKKGREHVFCFVDMAGDLFCGMVQDVWLTTDNYNDSIREFDNFFVKNKKDNPRMHIFVVEYHNEDELIYKDMSQSAYLETGLQRLKRQAIDPQKDSFLMAVTKTDLMPKDTILTKWLDNHDYMNEFNILARANSRRPTTAALDIGEVCFQDLCHFNCQQAEQLLDHLLEINEPFAK